MSKNHHGGPAPIPPGNRQHMGPSDATPDLMGAGGDAGSMNPDAGSAKNEQDPQRRLGNFETAGEHSRQQPGRLNDGDHHSR